MEPAMSWTLWVPVRAWKTAKGTFKKYIYFSLKGTETERLTYITYHKIKSKGTEEMLHLTGGGGGGGIYREGEGKMLKHEK